jgi:sugar phosphate isomerase/epimerase
MGTQMSRLQWSACVAQLYGSTTYAFGCRTQVHPLSIAHLTALPLNPPQLVQLAAHAGCTGCGLRLLPANPGGPAYPLMHDAPLLRETLARMQGTEVTVFDLEIVRLNEQFDVAPLQAFFELGQRLGARCMLVVGDDPDEARLTAKLAALCEAAAPYGLSTDLEFLPWTQVPNLSKALRVVRSAAQANSGVLIDALHLARSASTLEEVRAVPPAYLHYAQLCDGLRPAPTTTEALIFDARCARLLPGEGHLPLAELLAALPADLPIALEIPHDVRAPALGYTAWASAAVQAARRFLGG